MFYKLNKLFYTESSFSESNSLDLSLSSLLSSSESEIENVQPYSNLFW